jgi:acetyl-CoA synthetase
MMEGMTVSSSTTNFRAARDQLLQLRDNHASAVAEFVWPDVGENFNWATDWFDVIATDNHQTALWIVEEDGSETKVTFAEMAERSDRVATWLNDQGVRRGDHVMLMLGNQVELWEAMLAILKLGAVILPTSTVLATHDLADRVLRGRVNHVIANAEDTGKFDGVAGEYSRVGIGAETEGWASFSDAYAVKPRDVNAIVAAGEPSLVYFTSGTTSKPKMVVHTQTSYPVGHLSTMYWLGLQPGDVHLAISSPGWGKHAWSCFFAPWNAEATVFIYNYSRFNPSALKAQLERAEVSTFCAPPTVWRMLIQSDLGSKPPAMREILSAGEPLNPEVINQIQRSWSLVVRDGYGQTETTAIIANSPGSALKSGSMGHPLPGVHVTLLDPITGEHADEGEICLDLSHPAINLMAGYFEDPERTAIATRDGYFHTGDVAHRDENGYITFIGRTDDIFKSSDYKVSPFEVESVLIEHPAIAEAYIALAPGWEANEETAKAVLLHARLGLPPYMRVRRIEFFELPKTISGKIRRVDLREREASAAQENLRLPDEWRDDQFPDIRKAAAPRG